MDIRVAGALKHSSVNGPGVRYVLFFQGCFHACPGCQNPETHSRDGGVRRDTHDGKGVPLPFSSGDKAHKKESRRKKQDVVLERRKGEWVRGRGV